MSLFWKYFFLFVCSLIPSWCLAQPYASNPPITRTALKQWYPQTRSQPDSVTPPLVVKKKGVIVLDPGHGGQDIGTQSVSKPRYQEKSLNLTTANFVKDYLQQLGYKVILTRKDDKFVSLERRAQFANEQEPDLFVSIHYNSAPSAEAEGIEVFFYQSSTDKKRTAQSKRLAQAVLKSALANTKAKSRGVKHGNFAVIRETNMPAILIEGGFVTNESELQKLKDPAYLKRLAWGIARGIEDYSSK